MRYARCLSSHCHSLTIPKIRLFGDPVTTGREAPELQIEVTARLGDTGPKIEHSPSHDVVPNVVDGWTFGNALGVGVLSVQEWWTVTDIIVHDLPPDVS